MQFVQRTLLGLAAVTLLAPASFASGPDVFRAQNCTSCHSVTAAGIARDADSEEQAADLSKVGADLDKRGIAAFLLKKTERNGEKHKKSFQGTTAELKVIAEWLETLK